MLLFIVHDKTSTKNANTEAYDFNLAMKCLLHCWMYIGALFLVTQ